MKIKQMLPIRKTEMGRRHSLQTMQYSNSKQQTEALFLLLQETRPKKKKIMSISRKLGVIKEKVLEKLAAAAVPADAFENTRHFLEGVIRDVTVAAHGLAKDALHRIKTHLVDILPSLSPAITTKMVDEAEKEANREHESEAGEEEEKGHEQEQRDHPQLSRKSPYASPASSLSSSLVKPFPKL